MTARADRVPLPPLAAAVEAGRADATALLRALIARQADGEAAVVATVARQLSALGAEIETLRYEPGSVPLVDEFASAAAMTSGPREAVIARFKGAGGGRSLLIFAHPDSEPVIGTETWRHDPFAGSILDGRLHGWGVADDLAGVAASISALAAIRAAGLALAGDVIVAITPSKRHARGIAAVLDHGVTADAALYLHPAESGVGLAEIKAFASGVLEFEITVPGSLPATHEPSHTAFAHRAVNPVDKALVLIEALRRLDEARGARVHHPRLEAAVGRSTNILIAAIAGGNAGTPQRMASTLRITGSVSFPPFETIAAVQIEVEAALATAAAADAFLKDHKPEIRWLSGVSGSDVPDDHPLYAIAAEAIRRVAGIATRVNPMHTSSDIRNPLVQKGIPAIGLGPLAGDLTHAGGHDEWVDIADHLRAVTVAALITASWCGINRSPAESAA